MKGPGKTLLPSFLFLAQAAICYAFSGNAPGDGGPNLVPMIGIWVFAGAAVLAFLIAMIWKPSQR